MADGKVTISTKLDTSGLEKGCRSVSGSLGGLKGVLGGIAKSVGLAFSVYKIVQFGAACVELGSSVTEVQNVVDTAFGEMAYKMESFADTAITSFGMSKLAAKKTGSTYMAMAKGMGMASDAASDMAIALTGLTGDVASFYNITQEEADTKLKSVFTGETETLKSLGVVMTQTNLDAYAMANGFAKTTSQMNQAELVQLRYAYVTNALNLAAGDFVKTQDSWANQTRILKMQWQEFMSIIGQALTTVLTPLVRMLNTIMAALIRVANTANSVVSAIFGGKNKQLSAAQDAEAAVAGIGDSAASAADGESALADATTAAGKAAKGALANFDDLNVLQQDTGSGTTSGASGASGGGSAGGLTETVTEEEGLSDRVQAFVDKIAQLMVPLKKIDFDPLVASFERLKKALEPLTEKLFSGLEWAWYNIFVPLAQWTIEDLLPVFLNVLSDALKVLNSVLDALKPLWDWFWENCLKPLAEWTGGVIVTVLKKLAARLDDLSDWISANQTLVQGMTITAAAFVAVWKVTGIAAFIVNMGGLSVAFNTLTTAISAATVAKIKDKVLDIQIIALYAKDFIVAIAGNVAAIYTSVEAWLTVTTAKIADTAAQWAMIAATTAWNALCAIATTVTTSFGVAVAFLTSPIGLVILAIGAVIAIIVLLIAHWDQVKAVALEVWENIKTTWGQVCEWFSTTVIDPLSSAWENFKTGFLDLWDGIAEGVKGAINSVIGFVNGMITAIVSGINAVIDALGSLDFDVPEWVPFVGGNSFGFNLTHLTAPQIPLLAQGAVIPPNREFLAVLGDQKSGTNIEAPLSTIKQALAEELAKLGGTGRGGDIVLQVDGKTFARILNPFLEQEKNRRGVKIIAGGAF